MISQVILAAAEEGEDEPAIEKVVFVCFGRDVYEAYKNALRELKA